MCGIVGFRSVHAYRALAENLPGAVRALSHRGPDDEGIFFDEGFGVGLGHRRLSILDLSRAGSQPMAAENRMVQIVHNGEVYNFRSIRRELEQKGHAFQSDTDTEVILKSYLEWGTGCLEKFVGMFAFAIWDQRRSRLFLARDRMGIKPLFYAFHQGSFFFASELKALMAFKAFPKEVAPESLPLFLHYQYIPAPRTVFRNTWKLLPGHLLLFDGRNMETQAYWRLPRNAPNSGPETLEGYASRLEELLTQAVSDRLISDVPLGAFLSGGIDSSLVVALMQKITRSPVRTFSIGFNEAGYDEAPWAARIARHLGTDHTEAYLSSRDALDIIPQLPEMYDEPFADPSAIPTFLVSRITRRQVTVALSGDGGDEQFCGYVRYWTTRAMDHFFSRFPAPLKQMAALSLKRLPPRQLERWYQPLRHRLPQRFQVANFPDKWQKMINLMQGAGAPDLYRTTISLWPQEEVLALTGRPLPPGRYEEAFLENETLPLLSRLMRVDLATYLPDAMLTKVDRASMASGLEVRVPLLDHRVLEFSAAIPERFHYRHGTGKLLLKHILARYLPRPLFERPKMGFGVPIDQWLRSDLKEFMLDHLAPSSLARDGIRQTHSVETRIREHLAGSANHQYPLWALLVWRTWTHKWLE